MGPSSSLVRPPLSSASSRSPTPENAFGIRCPYRLSVVVIDVCPSRAWIAFGCTPAAMRSEAWVCRRSWNRMSGTRAATRCRLKARSRLSGSSGPPACERKT